MKKAPARTPSRPASALFQRLQRAAALHHTTRDFAARLTVKSRRVSLRGTKHSFTFSEIARLTQSVTRRAKIAQSDVPDNMLSLLTALRAATGAIPS